MREARPTDFERVVVSDELVKQIKQVGAMYIEILKIYNGTWFLNTDGIRLHGQETAQHVARIYQACARGSITPAETYASHLANLIYRHFDNDIPLVSEDEELKPFQIYMTSLVLDSMPFQAPLQNKSPVAPSPSRRYHGDDTYEFGFSRSSTISDFHLDRYDHEAAMFFFDAWNLNSVGRGERIKDQTHKLAKGYVGWATNGNGSVAAKKLGITGDPSPQDVAKVVLGAINIILEEEPDGLSIRELSMSHRLFVELRKVEAPKSFEFDIQNGQKLKVGEAMGYVRG
ncbi:hypothetical protein JCM8547_005238 [Rhodosporidiobolus lusitaniae]